MKPSAKFCCRLAAFVLGGFGALSGTVALAQTYPARPLRIIVPFPAGGAQDVLTRLVAQPLSEQLKQPVIVENKPGAAGNIGAYALAKAHPDGYTLGILSGVQTANTAFYRKIPFDLTKDFEPVKALGDSAVLLARSKAAPFNNLPQFLAYAKSNPGKVQVGTTTSLTIDLLKVQAGVDLQLIPYKGVGDALQDLVAGRLDVVAGPALQMIPMIKAGQIEALALASTRRVPELPGIPAIGEIVPGYDAGMWYGIFVPAGTPPAIVQLLARDLTVTLDRSDIRQRMADLGVDAGFSKSTPQALESRMQSEIARWRRVAAATGNYAN